MEYNLLSGAIVTINLTEGNKDVSFNDLTSLISYGDYPILSLESPNILAIDFDLGRRIHIDRVDYKFEAEAFQESVVLSGIQFLYKNEPFETIYTSLVTYSSTEDNVYTTTLSGVWGPRYIRIIHDLNASTVSGSVYGIRVVNYEDIVNFGEDGFLEEISVEAARGGAEDIREISIFNNSNRIADALINLEPTYTELDTIIALSTCESGPWIYPLSEGSVIFDSNTYNSGKYSGTQITYSFLEIEGFIDREGYYSALSTKGYYYTPVFYNPSKDGALFGIERSLPHYGRIAVDREDAIETIEIRSTNVPPKSYAIIRELYDWTSSYTAYFSYKDRWAETGAIKYTSTNSFYNVYYQERLYNYQVRQDSDTERWAGWFATQSTGSNGIAGLYLFNGIGNNVNYYRVSQHSASQQSLNFGFRELKLDSTGGMWIYFYCVGYRDTDFCDKTGYYLAYFDYNFVLRFKYFSEFEEVGSLYADYQYTYGWYTNPTAQTIYRLSIDGTILVNYSYDEYETTNNLNGLVVLPNEQGIWFGNGKDLHRLSNLGVYLIDYSIENATQEDIVYLALDGDGSEALWILEGLYVGRFYISGEKRGTYDFKIALNNPVKLEPTSTGCWVYCAETDVDLAGKTYIRFISKENRREEVTYAYSPSTTSRPGPLELTYEHPNYVSKMPLDIDSHWKDLLWNKVAVQNYLSPETTYNQIRLSLRRQEPIERYDFVTDADKDYKTSDDFIQTSPIPDKILWGRWLDSSVGDGLNRAYVDTIDNCLFLIPDPGGLYNSYIDTYQRVLTKLNTSNELEVRIKYKIGDGNTGTLTGKSEYLYLYGYSMDENKEGYYIGIYLYIHANPISNSSYIYMRSSGVANWSSYSIGSNAHLSYYEGTLRLNISSDLRLYGQIASGDSTSFVGNYVTHSSASGEHWYWGIVSDRNSTQVAIENFEILKGDNFFYTESPKIISMHTQDLVSLQNIYPGSYKKAYIKTQIPANSSLGNNYEMSLKTMWRTPVY